MTLYQRDRENYEWGVSLGVSLGVQISIERYKNGEEKLDKLSKLLLEEHRMDELKQAIEDINFRNQLYEEYNL